MKFSLVIPAYNEEIRLKPFLGSIFAYINEGKSIHEVIVVDDGSKDKTVDVVKEYLPQVSCLKLIVHEKNKGKGGAIQTGVFASTGDVIIFMDADGATDISELPKMLHALTMADIGIGNRWMQGSETKRHSALRKLSGWVYRTYMSLFGLGSIDTMCGFKGYKRSVALDLFTDLLEERWLFDTEIAYKAVKKGYSIHNFPIHWESKDGSKLSTSTLIMSALEIFPLILRIQKQLAVKNV